MRITPKLAVLVSLALVAPVVWSATVQAAPKQVLTISAPKMVIEPAPIIVRGTITNGKPGQKVGLQQFTGSTFSRSFMTTKLDAHLAYKFSFKAPFARAWTLRTATPTGLKSKIVTTVVQHWMYLADLGRVVDSTALTCGTSVVMGGHTYAHSCALEASTGTATSVAWKLFRGCSKLRGTFGVTDGSATEADATLTATTDKHQIYAHSYGVGQSTPVTVNIVPGRVRLTFDALQSQPASGDVVIGLGNAQILCRWGESGR